ncbi:MAG: glutathione peroxidase [Muribaculum sp.]|nr:glutathione peroxidase [Muribaculum sp.]
MSDKSIYDFKIVSQSGDTIPMSDFKEKVLLIVNTASRCGFTPQYEDLERLYEKYHDKGLEILDFPCNQFGQQSPESDKETTQFCQLNYGTKFPQYKKIEVNGANQTELYKWLKQQKGFGVFDTNTQFGKILDEMMSKQDPNYADSPDIKWNFTKFLIDREGNVVARFEPTDSMEIVEREIQKIL